MNAVWFLLYNAIVYPLLFFVYLLLCLFNGKVRAGFWGRFSTHKVLKQYFNNIETNRFIYWYHAASLGEFQQIRPVLEGVKEVVPDSVAVVSFYSPSGYQNASCAAMDLKVYLPFDFLWSVDRALAVVNPRKLIFAAYDIWPNLIWSAKRKNIHTNIFAARVKDGSYKMKPVFRRFYRSVYRSFATIYTIAEKDYRHIRAIIGEGNSPKLRALGNPRYDMVKQSADNFTQERTESILSRGKRLILGSIHQEDDEVILPAVWELLRTFPELKILYVPHEPGKTVIEKYRNIFQQEGFAPAVITDKANLVLPGERVVILGVVGVLASLYWLGQVAYIGGGFSKGIHNIMEPAIARLPVLFGPRHQHFQAAEELLQSGGGFAIHSGEEFKNSCELLFTQEDHFLKSSLAATEVIHRNLGSATRIVRSLIRD